MRNPAWIASSAALLMLAGCGSSAIGARSAQPVVTLAPPTPGDLDRVLAAARATLASSSAVSVRLKSASVFGTAPRPVGGTGRFDFAASQGDVELRQATGPERIVFLPQSVFVAQANPRSLLPAGKIWISAGLTERSSATNFSQFVTQAESLNPGLVLSEVLWGAVLAAPISTRAFGGAHQYAVQVDLAEAKSVASGPSGEAFRRVIDYQLSQMSGATVPTQISLYLAIDEQGRISTIQGAPAGAGAGTVTVNLSDFGVTVHVTPPTRATVADISSLAPGGEQENAGGSDSDGA